MPFLPQYLQTYAFMDIRMTQTLHRHKDIGCSHSLSCSPCGALTKRPRGFVTPWTLRQSRSGRRGLSDWNPLMWMGQVAKKLDRLPSILPHRKIRWTVQGTSVNWLHGRNA